PAQRGEQPFGPLAFDDPGDDVDVDRLDVDDVGDVLVRHDRRRVGVDEDRAHALLAHRLARLRPGVVELRRLADHDRPGADDEDACRFAHRLLTARPRARRCSGSTCVPARFPATSAPIPNAAPMAIANDAGIGTGVSTSIHASAPSAAAAMPIPAAYPGHSVIQSPLHRQQNSANATPATPMPAASAEPPSPSTSACACPSSQRVNSSTMQVTN